MRLEAGELVDGRYRLVGRIGSGGMADVWGADDTMLERRVALKFLHERFAQDRQFVERFRREAQSAAGLSHPNVVGVYDRGEWEGMHYIAMEFVRGASLKDLIGKGLTVPEAVEIVRQVLSGVRFAHERGIVHRDLKPQNVLVDAEGRARVADFGIARAGASEITQTGSVLGTAQYLSPEQAQGLEVTPASDLYSVGVMLYEALTGSLPFQADTPVAVALKQISERPRPPSELNPQVSPALDAVVLRALAKEPANRFSTANEFIAALDAAEADPAHAAAAGDTAAYGALAGGALAGAAGAAALGAGAEEAQAATPDAGAAAGEAGQAAGAGPPPGEAGEEPPEEEDEGGWMTRRRAIILGVLLLALGGVAAYALTRPDEVTVPRVIGESRGVARAQLEQRGFEVKGMRSPFCAPKQQVTEQDPQAGTMAEKGSTVTITYSSGLPVIVPAVAGLRQARATNRLQDAQVLVQVEQRSSSRVKPGRAIGTEPGQGSEVECKSRVTLLMSRGPNLETVPDVLGQDQTSAEAHLEELGFVADVESKSSDAEEGTVIEEDPGPGSRIARGSRVAIVVSTGPEAVSVPNVVGQSKDAAVSSLQGRGFSVRVNTRTTDDEAEDDIVLEQSPTAGTRLVPGEFVTIFVGRFEAPPTDATTPEGTP